MDGFRDRDRMSRGGMDRAGSDRYDRYDRYPRGGGRGGSYQAGAPEGVSAEEITGIVEESNTKQLDIINDFFEDAKEDRLESEKQIISAIDNISKELSREITDKLDSVEKELSKEPEIKEAPPAPAPVVDDKIHEDILRTVNSNNDLLATFAEEQLPMLVRGNSSTLNQISQTLENNDDLLRQILSNTNSISTEIAGISAETLSSSPKSDDDMPVYQSSYSDNSNNNNEELLQAATNNGAMLNALRSELASLQQQINEMEGALESNRQPADDNAPLDSEDTLTKSQADELYKSLEEHVHSECVKVYRNFQKTLEDQNKTVVEEVGKGSGSVRIFALLAVIFSFFNLVLAFINMYFPELFS